MASEFGVGEWLWMMASFLLVIGLLVATLFILKRMTPGVRGAAGRRLSISEVQHVGPRQKLLLIQLNGDEILVGQSAQSMTLLGTWNIARLAESQGDTDDSDTLTDTIPAEAKGFRALLSQFVKRQGQ